MSINDIVLRMFGPGNYTLINWDDKLYNVLAKENFKVKQLIIEPNNCEQKVDFLFDGKYTSDYIFLNITNLQTTSQIFDIFKALYGIVKKGMFVKIEGKSQIFNNDSLEELLFTAGFSKHPAYYENFCDYVEDFDSENNITSVVQPRPVALLDSSDSEAAAYLLSQHDVKSRWYMDAYTDICSCIRPNDRVLNISRDFWGEEEILKSRSLAAQITTYYLSSLHKLNDSSLVNGSVVYKESITTALEELATRRSFFDFIILQIGKNNPPTQYELSQLFERISPGGRIAVLSECSNNDTYTSLADSLGQFFDIEQSYQGEIDSGNTSFNKRFKFSIVDSEYIGGLESSVVALLAMKSPLNISAEQYRETVYEYSSPPENLLAFSRDYCNPWLVRSVVEFPFRNRNPKVLKQYATEIIEQYPEYSPDVGAALAILGYQELGRADIEFSTVETLCSKLINYCANPQLLTAHQVRWKISLLYLAACLYKKIGLREKAFEHFIATSEIDCTLFSPTIGTKTLMAIYEAAMSLASDNRIPESLTLLRKGIQRGANLLKCSPEEILGRLDTPHTFTLYIYHDIFDVLIKISNAIRLLNCSPQLLYRENAKTWSGLLAERMAGIQDVEKLYIDAVASIECQARLIDERWDTIQNMEGMIADRDKVINEQAAIVNERWNAIQNMDVMISERDKTIKEYQYLIEQQQATINQHKNKLEQPALPYELTHKIEEQIILIEEQQDVIREMQSIISERELNFDSKLSEMLEEVKIQAEKITAMEDEHEKLLANQNVQKSLKSWLLKMFKK